MAVDRDQRASLIYEAKLQTEAIQRLNLWLRLSYSLLTIGALIGVWAVQHHQDAAIVGAAVCLLVALPSAGVLKLGTTRAKRNVERILEAAGVDLRARDPHPANQGDPTSHS